MAIWKHSVCGGPVDNPGEPVGCPLDEIPVCNEPNMGFDIAGTGVWRCQSCGWLILSEETPAECTSLTAQPCQNPDGGTFQKISD